MVPVTGVDKSLVFTDERHFLLNSVFESMCISRMKHIMIIFYVKLRYIFVFSCEGIQIK